MTTYEQREEQFRKFNNANNGPDKHDALLEYNRLDAIYQKEQADLKERMDIQAFEDIISPPIEDNE